MTNSLDRSGQNIIVFGDVIDDIVVVPSGPIRRNTDTPSSITQRPGGSASNVASWLGVLGAPVDFVGRVGADDLDRHKSSFADFGVRAHLSADPLLPTGSIVVLVEGDERTMLTERGANDHFSAASVTDELLANAAVVHFTGYSIYHATNLEPIRDLYSRTKDAGVSISIDPASAGSLSDFGVEKFFQATEGTSFCFPNLDEGLALTGLTDPEQIAKKLTEHFPMTVLTLGRDGVVVAEAGSEPKLFEAIESKAVDPTGAGDAFVAGFLAAWTKRADVEAAVALGQATASKVVGQLGARPPRAHRIQSSE